MKNIYELFGRMAEQLEKENAEHLRTIDILRQLKEGKITLEQLSVTENSWAIQEAPKQ